MKKTEVLAQIQAGKPIVFAEWRSCEARTMSGVTQSNKPYSMPLVEHNVEIDGKPYAITENLPDGSKTDTYRTPFKKGEVVAMELELLDVGKGMWRVKGRPHACE